MKIYKHLFFDLDRTLWDFETNALDTFKDIYEKFKLNRFIAAFDEFVSVYHSHNNRLWEQYRNGELPKATLSQQRFEFTLRDFGVDDKAFAGQIAQDYLTISPTKTVLFPYAIEVLESLKQIRQLHIITNGFIEVQKVKLQRSRLNPYFTQVITSEDAGAMKPNRRIFDFAVEKTNALRSESLMIGDDYTADIIGAKEAGIDQVFFNPQRKKTEQKATYEIQSLKELLSIEGITQNLK